MAGKSSVTVKIDKNVVKAKLQAKWEKSLFPLSVQVLADMNEYCRKDIGNLILSSATASDFDRGILKWDTPYARRVYYTGNPSTDGNKKASLLWCEVAKTNHNEDWQKIAEKLFKEGI